MCEAGDLIRDLEVAEGYIVQLESRVEELEARVSDLEAERDALIVRGDNHRRWMDAMTARIDDLEAALTHLIENPESPHHAANLAAEELS